MGKPFLYRCPIKGMNVQGYEDDDDATAVGRGDRRYRAVTCLACGQLHLVNPSARLSPEDEEE